MAPELIQLEQIDNHANEFFCVPGELWGQGYATYGGYVAASCYKAAKLAGHERPLLSAQVNFLAPSAVNGYRLTVKPLRVGKGTSIVEVCSWSPNQKTPQDPDVLAAKILFTYGEPRGSNLHVRSKIDSDTMDALIEARANTPDFRTEKSVPLSFLDGFHFRYTKGDRPFANSNRLSHIFAFTRKNGWSVHDPVEFLVLVSDINTPPQMQLLSALSPGSTMTWMLDIAQPLPNTLSDSSWLHVIVQLEHAANGYGAHSGIIVDEQGQVLSSTRQVTAVFERDDASASIKNFTHQITGKGSRAFNSLEPGSR